MTRTLQPDDRQVQSVVRQEYYLPTSVVLTRSVQEQYLNHAGRRPPLRQYSRRNKCRRCMCDGLTRR